jgi:hypothetical protein
MRSEKNKKAIFGYMKDLLIHLIQYPFDPLKKDRLRELVRQVQDWHALVELINAHGIISLAAYNIKESGLKKEVPGAAMALLENGYRQSMVRNTWLTERWKEVNAILCNAGIKHILLKGMALEHTLYDSKGLRQMTDNDILIKREDSLKAWYLLQKEGFSHDPIKSHLHKKMLTVIGKHLPTLSKDGYDIEIHHSLFESEVSAREGNIDMFGNADEISIGDTNAVTLSKEIQLKYLISHFNRHALEGSSQLRLYADIILLDNTIKIDIPESFIFNPNQENKPEFRKAAYKINILSIPVKYRLQYVIGDIFPSVRWMKERYKCTGLKVWLWYVLRIGKLRWLW